MEKIVHFIFVSLMEVIRFVVITIKTKFYLLLLSTTRQ